MRKSRVRKLKDLAFENGRDGSLVVSHEFDRLKKSYKNKSYAKVVVQFPSKPGYSFLPKYKTERNEIQKRLEKSVIDSIRDSLK